MKSQLAIGLVLGALALSGCTSTSGNDLTSAGSGSPTTGPLSGPLTGRLSGTVRIFGGPLNPTTGKMAANGEPGQGQVVTVLLGTQVVARQSSDAQGHFTFHLPAGTYTLGCQGGTPVAINPGTTRQIDCHVDVP